MICPIHDIDTKKCGCTEESIDEAMELSKHYDKNNEEN